MSTFRKIFFAVFTVLVFPFFAQTQTINEAIEQVRADFKNGKIETAFNEIELILNSPELPNFAKEYAEALTLKGTLLRKKRKFSDALDFHGRALQVRGEHFGNISLEFARSASNIGNVFFQKGELASADKYFTQSLKIHESIGTDLSIEAFRPQLGLAKIFIKKGMLSAAKNQLDKLEVMLPPNTFSPEAVNLNSTLSDFYLKKGNSKKAEEGINEMLKTYKILFNKNPEIELDLLQKFVNLKIKKGQFSKAEKILFEAIEKAQKSDLPTNFSIGISYQSLGNIAYQRSDWKAALSRFEASKSNFEEEDFEQIEVLTMLGKIRRIQNQNEPAEYALSEAMSYLINFENHDKYAAVEQKLYIELGTLANQMKIPKLVKINFEKALKIPSEGRDFDERKLTCHLRFANLLLQEGKLDLAKSEVKKAKKFLTQSHGSQAFSVAAIQGKLLTSEGRFLEAEKQLKTALSYVNSQEGTENFFLFEKIQGQLLLAENQAAKAQLSTDFSDWKAVLAFAEKGIENLEKLSGNFNDPDSEIDLSARFSKLFDLSTEASFYLQKSDSDFIKKGLLLAESFKNNRLSQLTFKTEILKENNFIYVNQELKKRLVAAKKERFLRSGGGNVSYPIPEELEKEIIDLQNQIDHLNSDSSPKNILHPQIFSIKNFEEIQNTLRANQTLLHFQRTDENIFVFLINSDTFFLQKTLGATESIEQLIVEYFSFCSIDPSIQKAPKEDAKRMVEISEQLYNSLIRPFDKNLRENLLIIPDGLMNYLPFGSLIQKSKTDKEEFGEHQYLIEQKSIQYLQSFTDFLNAKTQKPRHIEPKFLAIAPNFLKNGSSLPPLAGTVKEAKILNEKLGGELWLQEAANKQNFEQNASKFNVILLATHSFAQDDDPAHSFIAFSEKENATQDELLTVSEIYNLNLNADLIVLSSCRSAAGKLLRGEGLMSIARAFFRVGTRSIVASFWNVSDKQAPEVITDFHENLNDGMDKPKALQKAKVNYFQNAIGIEAHPFYWAGFVSINDDSPVNFANTNSFIFWLLSLLFIGLLGSVFYFKPKATPTSKVGT